MKKILFLLYISTAVFTAGCGDSYKHVHDDITGPVQSVKLKPATSVAEGNTEQLSVTVYPSMTPDKRVTWSSSDDSLVTVDQRGIITGVADGTATVRATSINGGLTADCVVTVLDMPVAVTGVYLNNSTLNLAVGGSSQLDAGFTPLSPGPTNQGLTWSSSNTTVADVNGTGLVHALSIGSAVITVTTSDGGYSAICVVTVLLVSPPSAPDPANVTAGNRQIVLNWTAEPGADSYEVWFGTVYNSSSASQSGGVITGITHTITGLTNGTVYYVWLKSKNATGTSGFSSVAWGTPVLLSGVNAVYTLPGPITFNMKSLSEGLFPIGVDDSESYQINHKYWIGETEVTFQLWDAVRTWAISHGYTLPNSGAGSGQLPVVSVNVRDAMVWCNALTEYYNANNGANPDLDPVYYTNAAYSTPLRASTNLDPVVSPPAGSEDNPYIKASVNGNLNMALCTAKGFRLPTSMEWELAARWRGNDAVNTVPGYSNPYYTKGNSASGAVSSNNGDIATVAWFTDNSGGSVHNPGGRVTNSLGLKDMCGNVNEWCFDVPSSNWDSRVTRGGNFNSFMNGTSPLQIGYQFFNYKKQLYSYLGFRLVRNE
ncbi:MAG: hypothetical protein CVV49_18710 [Spirochaetae bacterium HGW-Spirochaetae-5]|nr:MAG: hypothetical protein CVV49_18710 [Spirochaetae bacterium HGW-Spirochaetae-5]